MSSLSKLVIETSSRCDCCIEGKASKLKILDVANFKDKCNVGKYSSNIESNHRMIA